MLPKKPVSSEEKDTSNKPDIPDISGETDLLKKMVIQNQQMLQALNKIVKQNEELLYQIKTLRKESDQRSLTQGATSIFGTLAKSIFSPFRALSGIFGNLLETVLGLRLLKGAGGLFKKKIPGIGKSVLGPFRGLGSVLGKLGLIGASIFTVPKIIEGYQMAQNKGVGGIGAVSRGIDYGILNTLTLGLLPPELNYMIVDLFNHIKGWLISTIWNGLSALFKSLVGKISESLSGILKDITSFITTSIDQLTKPVKAKLTELTNTIGTPIVNFLDKTTDPLKPLFKELSNWFEKQNQVIPRPPKTVTPSTNQVIKLDKFVPGVKDTFSVPDKLYNRLKDGGGESESRPISVQLPEGFKTLYQEWKNTTDPVKKANIKSQLQKQYPDIYKQVFSNTAAPSNIVNSTVPSLMNIRPAALNILNKIYLHKPSPDPIGYRSELASLNQFQSYLTKILPASQRYDITQLTRDNPGSLRYGIHGHLGTDIATPVGTLLRSPMSGYVILRETAGGWGKHAIIINGQAGIILGHLSQFDPYLVKKIQSGSNIVHPGEAIGLTGNTGNSTGPHLDVTVFKMVPKGNQAGEYQVKYLQSYKDIVNTMRQATTSVDYKLAQEMAKKFSFNNAAVASTPVSDLVTPMKTVSGATNFSSTDPFVSLPFDPSQTSIATTTNLLTDLILSLNRAYASMLIPSATTMTSTSIPKTPTVTTVSTTNNKSITPSKPVVVNAIPLNKDFNQDSPATGVFQINYQRMIDPRSPKGGIDWGALFSQTKDRIIQGSSDALFGALDQMKSGAIDQLKSELRSLPIINQLPEPILNLAEQKISSAIQTGNLEISPNEIVNVAKSLFPQVGKFLSKPITIPISPESQGTTPSNIPDTSAGISYNMTPQTVESNELKSIMIDEQISTASNQRDSTIQSSQSPVATPTVTPIPVPSAPVNVIAPSSQSPLDDMLILLNTVFRM